MLVGAVDAVEFRRARGFGAPVVVHGCEYVRDCVQEGEGVLEIFFMVVESTFGEYLEGANSGLAGFGKQAVRRGKNLKMD
jgi:hypothetical protein